MKFKSGDVIVHITYKEFVYLVLEVENEKLKIYKVFILKQKNKECIGSLCLSDGQQNYKNLKDVNLA